MKTVFLLCLMAAAVLLTAFRAEAQQDSLSDTWVATDGLGRALPTNAQTGPPRANKTVGMFYFLTFDHGQDGPYDNTKILATHPEALNDVHNPAWGPLNASHYWGEPLFGYYASDDEYVLRKHAQMLSAAGVDVVIFDNSNAVTYDRARNKLCRVWEQIRREGGQTPQIAFLCPFGNPNNIGGSTLRELYDTIYAPGLYSDLWFRWQGKPLVLADPSYAAPGSVLHASRQPAELQSDSTLGQSFTVTKPFTAAGGMFPTWARLDSRVTMSLYANGPGGARLAQKTTAVADNAAVLLDTGKPLPAGKYYLEISNPVGRVGWWGYLGEAYPNGQAFDTGEAVPGDRTLLVRFAGQTQAQALSPGGVPAAADPAAEAKRIAEFFTFRSPIPEYNNRAPKPGHWAWLQVYPQAPQVGLTGQKEQITVGVAQNYNATVNRTAPMSVPGAFGRSYHDGKRDTRPGAVNYGFNFAEQWEQARKTDPPFVFVTGWNEWTAGFYEEWARFHAPPAIFVDQFTQEFSRDIEPMTGGHGDNYYYQLVDNIRRYKGVRPVPPVVPAPITMDGTFAAWQRVQPEFRNAVSAPVHRDSAGFAKGLRYTNATGRNNILASKVSFDAHAIYFYVRTRDKLTPRTDRDWMRLYLNTDGNAATGWQGYDYAVNGQVGSRTTLLEKHTGAGYQWAPAGQVNYQARGNEMVIAIPRLSLGIRTLPATIDFKWADNCYTQGDWTDFLVNGDAAPIGRFSFRAILQR